MINKINCFTSTQLSKINDMVNRIPYLKSLCKNEYLENDSLYVDLNIKVNKSDVPEIFKQCNYCEIDKDSDGEFWFMFDYNGVRLCGNGDSVAGTITSVYYSEWCEKQYN